MRANSGASAAAGGLHYQYLVTLERLLDLLDAAPTGELHVHVDSSPRHAGDDEIVDYAVADEGGRVLSIVQVRSTQAPGRRRLGAPGVVAALCRLVAVGDAPHFALVTNADLTKPAQQVVRAVGDPALTGERLRARLSELCPEGSPTVHALRRLPADAVERLKRCEVARDSRSPDALRADLRGRVRAWRMSQRLEVAEEAAGLLTAHLVLEVFERAVPHGARSIALSELRRLLLTDPVALTLAAGARPGVPLGARPWVPDVARREPLERLTAILQPLRVPERVVGCAITGLSGLGKTSLAAAYAHEHAAVYDVVVWLDAESVDALRASVEAVLDRVCELTGADPAAARPLEERLSAVLGEHTGSWLVVFDGACDLASLEPWLPRAGAGHVLVTSTDSAGWSQLERLPLSPMTEAESLALLERRLGPILGSADGGELQTLARTLEHWPLALELAAAYILSTGLAARAIPVYLETLRERAQADESLVLASYPRTLVSAIGLCVDRIRERAEADRPDDVHRIALAVLDVIAYFGSRAIPLQLALACALMLPSEKERLGVGAGEILDGGCPPQEVLRVLLTQSLVIPDRDRASSDATTLTFSVNEVVQSVLRGWHEDELAVAALLERIAFHVQDWLVGFGERRAFEALALVEPHAAAVARHLERQGWALAYGCLLLGNLASAYRLRGWVPEAMDLLSRELAYVDRLGVAAPALRLRIHSELAVLRLRGLEPDEAVVGELTAALGAAEAHQLDPESDADLGVVENLLAVYGMLRSRGCGLVALDAVEARVARLRGVGRAWNAVAEQLEIHRLISGAEPESALERVAAALAREDLVLEERQHFLGLAAECLAWLRRRDDAERVLERLAELTGETGHLADVVAEQVLNVALAASSVVFEGDPDGLPLMLVTLDFAHRLLELTPRSLPAQHARLAAISAFAAACVGDEPAVRKQLAAYLREDLERDMVGPPLVYDLMHEAAAAWLRGAHEPAVARVLDATLP